MRGAANSALAAATRMPGAAALLADRPAAALALLAALGTGAALLTAGVDLDLRVPGHSILKGVLPLALGLALVPGRYSGSVMGVAAFGAVLAQGPIRGGNGWGATASLVLLGPILDALLRGAGGPRSVHLRFLVAGLLANLSAFGVRLGAKLVFHDGGRPLAAWWPEAIVTYALCGLLAGALASALCFRYSSTAR